jgi:hypothetical protein
MFSSSSVPHHSGRTTALSMIRALAQGLQLSKSFVHICHDRATTSDFPPNNYEPPMASRPMGCRCSARANATTRPLRQTPVQPQGSASRRRIHPFVHDRSSIGMNPLLAPSPRTTAPWYRGSISLRPLYAGYGHPSQYGAVTLHLEEDPLQLFASKARTDARATRRQACSLAGIGEQGTGQPRAKAGHP